MTWVKKRPKRFIQRKMIRETMHVFTGAHKLRRRDFYSETSPYLEHYKSAGHLLVVLLHNQMARSICNAAALVSYLIKGDGVMELMCKRGRINL